MTQLNSKWYEEAVAAGLFDFNLAFQPGPYNQNLWWYYQRDTVDQEGKLHKVGEVINRKQGLALAYRGMEMFYGGAPKGAKSTSFLMLALQHLYKPDFSALMIRRTMPELRQKDGLFDQCKRFLKGTPAQDCFYERDMQLIAPEGGMIQFGYCEQAQDIRRYLGGRYVLFCFDECTDIDPEAPGECYAQAVTMKGSKLKAQFRFGSNPGGPYEDYYRERFIENGDVNHLFLEADYKDNPLIDQDAFLISLSQLPEHRRLQLLEKRWGLKRGGDILKGDWFEEVDTFKIPAMQIRSWDVAGTVRRADGRISDETVGTLWWVDNEAGKCCIAEQIAFRGDPDQVENRIEKVMKADEAKLRTRTVEELPPGEAGVARRQQRMKRFIGHWYELRGTGGKSKELRATQAHIPAEERAFSFAESARAGLIKVLKEKPGQEKWIQSFKTQCNTFGQKNLPNDRIDSSSLGYSVIKFKPSTTIVRSGMITTRQIKDFRSQSRQLLGRRG